MNEIQIKVAIVVVTYNRLQLLKECIDGLRNQTYKNADIIIVNNGSTDGTREWLAAQSDLIVITQENLGGAGGFYAGMKYMYEHAYEALCLMDDDGLPDFHQLEYLIKYSQKYHADVANALVINRKDHSQTVHGQNLYVFEGKEFIPEKSFLFNGTLIYRHVIEKIGFIKKEMFIWGDEVEYKARINAAGFKIGTIPLAIHYHPPFYQNSKRIIPFIPKGTATFKPTPKDKIFFRNLGYIDKTYNRHNFLRYWAYFLVRLNFKGLSYFHKYYMMGRKNDYSIKFL